MKIIFLGTPEIAVPSLEFFIKNDNYQVLGVITQPDRPCGRGHKSACSPVKTVAEKNNIQVFQPNTIRKEPHLIERIRQMQPDFLITVAFGQILSQEILDIPKYGTINMHASLLPKYRGANPIQWAIINGDKITGITTMLTDIGVDTGAMLLKKEIKITQDMTSCELAEIIAKEAPVILDETLVGIVNGSIKPIPQNDNEATHAPKLTKLDGKINWDEPPEVIHNKVRGMKPFPASYTLFRDDIVKIIETEIDVEYNTDSNKINGEILGIINNAIRVKTEKGTIIVKKLQPTCKKPVEAGCWCNGIRIQQGDKFNN